MDQTSGPESLGPEINKPQHVRVLVAENVRATREGGLRTRNGFEQKADLALDTTVDDVETHPQFATLFCKCGTKIQQSRDGETFYDIGLTQTVAEKTFLFPFRKDIFAINNTDSGVRIALSTVAVINDAGNILTVRAGDIDQFSASGTVYAHGIAITYSGVAGNTLTGCSSLAGLVVGDIITQTSTPSGFPKGSCMAELEGSAIVGGVSADPSALYWSEPSSPADPELFWSFPATYVKSLPSPITALKTGNSVLLIGLKKGLQYSTGFDVTTGVVLTLPLSDEIGIPNARCMSRTEDGFVILTSTGRILLVAQTDAGFKVVQNIDDPKQDMDYPVQGFIRSNMDRETLDENFIHYDPASKEISACIRMNTGLTREFTYQRDIRAWTHDTGKNFRCKTNFKGRTYAGDDSDSLIHLVDEGWTDNGIPINPRIAMGILRATRRGVTCDYLLHTFGGLLNATGQFYMRILLNGSVVENKLYRAVGGDDNDSLQELMLMDVESGVAVGGGQVGAEQIGSGGQVADAFSFNIPYEFMGEGEQAQIEFETTDEATIFELRFSDLQGETEGELLLTHT